MGSNRANADDPFPKKTHKGIKLQYNPIKTFSVTHLSPLPPPIGGVSVFVKRLHMQLLAEGFDSRVAVSRNWNGELSVGIYQSKGFPWRFAHLDALLHFAMPTETDIVHCHNGYQQIAPILAALRARGRKLVITVHSPLHCIPPARFLPWQKWFSSKIITDPTIQWVAVSAEIAKLLNDAGIVGTMTVLPAYLPDPVKNASLPAQLDDFINSHTPLLFVYAYNFVVNGDRDLYGFDEAIQLLKRLLTTHPKAGLLLLCSEPHLLNGQQRINYLNNMIMRFGLQDHCCLHLNPLSSLQPILSRCSLYLRPTLNDGDSVLVREALATNCKVVASDAVIRPDGVFTYALNNRQDLDRVVIQALESPVISDHTQADIFPEMMRIYRMVTHYHPSERL